MGRLLVLAMIAGLIYIYYNAWKGTPKKFFMKIYCILTGFFNLYSIAFYYFKDDWGSVSYFAIGFIMTISVPFVAKSFEKRNK